MTGELNHYKTQNLSTLVEAYYQYIAGRHPVEGALVCGSYAAGSYNAESDIDVLFLVKEAEFSMILELYRNILFDRILVDFNQMMDIVTADSVISNILSYSIGSHQTIIHNSWKTRELVETCQLNIQERRLSYERPKNRPRKIADGVCYRIEKEGGDYFLTKLGVRIA